MNKAERTRQYIISKTAPIFNSKGFAGTTLSDVTEATGLSKGSLYGNFVDKEELAISAFVYSVRKVKEEFSKDAGKDRSPKDRILAMLRFYSRYVLNPPIPGGCPLLNYAVETDDFHTSMRELVVRELNKPINYIANLLREGINCGEFKEDIKPKQLAYSFFCAVEGAIMFSRAERSDECMKAVVKECKQTLDRISTKTKRR